MPCLERTNPGGRVVGLLRKPVDARCLRGYLEDVLYEETILTVHYEEPKSPLSAEHNVVQASLLPRPGIYCEHREAKRYVSHLSRRVTFFRSFITGYVCFSYILMESWPSIYLEIKTHCSFDKPFNFITRIE